MEFKEDITPRNSKGEPHGLWVGYHNNYIKGTQRCFNGVKHGIRENYDVHKDYYRIFYKYFYINDKIVYQERYDDEIIIFDI